VNNALASFQVAKKFEIAKRRAEVTALYLEGVSRKDIAQQLGVSYQIVCSDINYVRKGWETLALDNLSALRGEELRRLMKNEAEAWAAFHRSTKPDEDGNATKPGDPRFLQGVRECIHMRAKLLGIYAPTQSKVDVDIGQKPGWEARVIDLTDDDPRRLNELVQRYQHAARNPRGLLEQRGRDGNGSGEGSG
jgi:hypothetical protein